jgi:dienelactone hydrolase
MKRYSLPLLTSVLVFSVGLGEDKNSAKAPAESPIRPVKVRTLEDKDFFFKPPKTREEWEVRRKQVREQILVANGLWPLPEKTPLNPVIHGKFDRDGYTIEKVYFASYPGHYVCGNLYRPKGKTGKLPAILNPHGHWENGRFHDAGEKTAEEEIKSGAEKTKNGGQFPSQAIPAQLARMGCVVFHYDMVGYADSFPIDHRGGFTDAEAELRLQSIMGLQTWNSIRALDFLTSLPEVDPLRIGVTGHSGGGTQTFILCAVDDRPAVAFPAVMVSTAMQGGCICENCSYLRQGTGNVEFAAMFAPKPLGMTGANDWTREIETKGLPELKDLYKLYGAEEKVMAKCFPQFGHNYNQVSREVMYNWFNKYLNLGLKEPVVEQSFEPVPPKELSVFDEEHPRPKDALNSEGLRKYLTQASDKQIEALIPRDKASLKGFYSVLGTALRVMANSTLPKADEVEIRRGPDEEKRDSLKIHRALIGRKGEPGALPAIGLVPQGFNGTVAVWNHPRGRASVFENDKPIPAVQGLLDKHIGVFVADLAGTGETKQEHPPAVNKQYAGFTFGYNRPLLAQRVDDVLTAVAFVQGPMGAKKIYLVGWEAAGPWTILANALCGNAVDRTAADIDQFRFDKVSNTNDQMMLPGALKYGGLPAFTALCAPRDLYLSNYKGAGMDEWVKPAYQAAKATDHLKFDPDKASSDKVIEWLLR